MKKYLVTINVSSYVEVEVEANSKGEAVDKVAGMEVAGEIEEELQHIESSYKAEELE